MRFSCCADCCAAGESRVRRPARSGGGRAGVQGYRQAAPAWRAAQAGKGMNGAGRRARRSADAMHGEAREHCHAKRFLQHGSVGSGGKSRTLRRGDSKGCAGTTGKAPRRGRSAFLQKGLAKNLVNAPRPAPDRGEGNGRFYAAFLRKLPAVLAPHGAHAGAVSAAGTGGAADTAGGDRRCAGRAVARGGTKGGRLRSRRGQACGQAGGAMDAAGAWVRAGGRALRRKMSAFLQKGLAKNLPPPAAGKWESEEKGIEFLAK